MCHRPHLVNLDADRTPVLVLLMIDFGILCLLIGFVLGAVFALNGGNMNKNTRILVLRVIVILLAIILCTIVVSPFWVIYLGTR